MKNLPLGAALRRGRLFDKSVPGVAETTAMRAERASGSATALMPTVVPLRYRTRLRKTNQAPALCRVAGVARSDAATGASTTTATAPTHRKCHRAGKRDHRR